MTTAELKEVLPVPYEEIVRTCPINRSPIFYMDVDFYIITTRGKKKTKHLHSVKKIVAKGTKEYIKSCPETKKRILTQHFRGASNSKTKALEFDLTRVEIKDLELRRYLGNGIK